MAITHLFTFAFLICYTLCDSLLDIEIETTKELVELLKNKSDTLSQIYDIKTEYEQLGNDVLDISQFEDMLTTQEKLYRRQGANFTELLGFEDPLHEPNPIAKPSVDTELDYSKKRERLESLFYERIIFNEKERNITHFEIMNVKPLTKASSGGFMTHGVLLGLDNKDMVLYDIYKNNLVNISMVEHGGIKLLQGSQHHDEMFIVAVSPTNIMCEFNITLHKMVSRGKKEFRSPSQIKKEFNPVNTTKSEEIGREDLFNKKYRTMLKTFEYSIEGQSCINLNETLQEPINPKHLIFYMNRGERYYLMTDYSGHLSVFYRGLSLKSRFYTGEDEIVQIVKQSLTIIIVHKHDIKFVRFFRSSMGVKKCHSGFSELTNIVVDQNHNGFIYGATTTGEILMFKTERLLQNVDTINCNIQGKLKVHIGDSYDKQLKVASLRNYLIALKSDGNLEIFDMTNIFTFMNRPVGYDIRLPYSHHIGQSQTLPDVKVMRSFNGDIILLNISPPNGTNKAVLYECITPVIRDPESESTFSFRFPMFFVVFIIILVFQFANRNNKNKTDLFSMILGSIGLGGGGEDGPKFKSKKDRDLHEIQKLVNNYTNQTDELNKKLASRKFI